jgi:hypothetical protein
VRRACFKETKRREKLLFLETSGIVADRQAQAFDIQ